MKSYLVNNCNVCNKKICKESMLCQSCAAKKQFKEKGHPMEGKEVSEKTRQKLSKLNSGKNHPQWIGGRVYDSHGYIKIYSPYHPNCNGNKYVFEHRLVMEKKLGRFLKPEEVVHHINEIKNDNREENLDLFPNKRFHDIFHKKGKKR